MSTIELPDPCVVILVGASGSGKSTFAAKHFPASSILSSDAFRAMVVDDENSLTVNEDAFDALNYVLEKRLKNMRLTVIDATNLQSDSRKALVEVVKRNDLFPVAIVMDTPLETCLERNAARDDRTLPEGVIHNHFRQARRASPKQLKREGIRGVHYIKPSDEVEIVRRSLHANRVEERGPFDLIGDVHGCFDELVELVTELGYTVEGTRITATPGRRLFFVGDLVDRGPKTPDVLRLVIQACDDGFAMCVPGNHDVKLSKALRGAKVTPRHGLQESLDQLAQCDEAFRQRVIEFIDGLTSHFIVDDGNLVVAHAGMTERYMGRSSGRVRSFALYGDTTGETDEFGLPVRLNWASEYRGRPTVVYGHTPTPYAEWLNDTICLDTGCVFGGKLTALRWPERELVSVPARHVYCEPVRPLGFADGRSAQQIADDIIDLDNVLGKRRIDTSLQGVVTIDAQNNAPALEVVSRFGVAPRWMPYLPPTMSPCEASSMDDWLERPEEAFGYFDGQGVTDVVCQEKHMGSRAIVVLTKDEDAAVRRFGDTSGRLGVVYTRTGRPFFSDDGTEKLLLERVRASVQAENLWDELQTDWICLDCELMPWSTKAQSLLQSQYASVGAAAIASLQAVNAVAAMAAARGVEVPFATKWEQSAQNAAAMRDAYRHYCWNVDSMDDLRLAPFHVLATEGRNWMRTPHVEHLAVIDRLCAHDQVLLQTARRFVQLDDPEQRAAATAWWEEMVLSGGEGIVVKPAQFTAMFGRGLVQPGIKVRGKEYLRLIYGPDYNQPANLERLRRRGLGRKRSLARREYALGVEALDRFVRNAPSRRVHECVFSVLALETEPVDPRL